MAALGPPTAPRGRHAAQSRGEEERQGRRPTASTHRSPRAPRRGGPHISAFRTSAICDVIRGDVIIGVPVYVSECFLSCKLVTKDSGGH